MCVPMCFGRASLVSQKSGLDPGKLLAGHSTHSILWVHLTRPTAQDAVWGRSPCFRSRTLNTRCVLPQGTAGAAHKHGAIEAPQFSQCLPKQTIAVVGPVPMVGARIPFTAAHLLPQRNPRAREISKQTWMWPWLPGPAPVLHSIPPWWLCSCVLPHLPETPARVSKAKATCTHRAHEHLPLSNSKDRSQSILLPLFCSPPNNRGRNSPSQTQELLYSALMSTDCLIFGLINSELLWYLKGGRKKN